MEINSVLFGIDMTSKCTIYRVHVTKQFLPIYVDYAVDMYNVPHKSSYAQAIASVTNNFSWLTSQHNAQ